MKKRSQRVIEKLRKLYPGNWRYDKDLRVWIGPEFEVRAYSVLNNQYDGDESSHRQLQRADTGERIFFYDMI